MEVEEKVCVNKAIKGVKFTSFLLLSQPPSNTHMHACRLNLGISISRFKCKDTTLSLISRSASWSSPVKKLSTESRLRMKVKKGARNGQLYDRPIWEPYTYTLL